MEVGSSCFVAAIFSVKNETAIDGKHRVARGMLWREMRRTRMFFRGRQEGNAGLVRMAGGC